MIYGFANRSATAPQPFKAENIIIVRNCKISEGNADKC